MAIDTLVTSFLSGGLAGGCVNAWFIRLSRRQDLRTKFHPKVNNMLAAYLIRMEKPQGRFWVTIVGQNPSNTDAEFVDHRSDFLLELAQYSELKEARVLRKAMLNNAMKGDNTPGLMTKLDLGPEAEALNKCLVILEEKLKLE
jgi:hypothetical protein